LRKILVLTILVVLITLLFVGCSQNTPADDILLDHPVVEPVQQVPEVLYLVTDYHPTVSPEYVQIEAIVKNFNDTHDTRIEWEILPMDAEKRESALRDINAEIAAGKGPDIFILPTEKIYNPMNIVWEPLIPDVNMAMRSGMFADISSLYEQDAFMSEDFHADGLNQTVLDTGVVNGFRYLLPLQYDYPVAYVNGSVPDLAGLESLDEILDACRLSGKMEIVSYAFPDSERFLLSMLPDMMDYESLHVGMEPEELAEYLQAYTRWMASWEEQRGFATGGWIDSYTPVSYWANRGTWVTFGSLDNAMLETAMARVSDVDLKIFPITSQDGRLTAKVTYYGAVSANCQAPNLAYEFLRQFLLEQHQWETADYAQRSVEDSNRYGWPVRTMGAVTNGFDTVKEKFDTFNRDDKELLTAIANLHLTDADVPILEVPLDGAYLPPSTLEYDLMQELYVLYDQEADSSAYLELAEDFIARLEKGMMVG